MTAPAGAGYILVGMAMVLLALRHFRIAGACGLLALAVAAASLRDGAIESGVAAPILREMALSGSGDGAGRGYGYTDPVTSTALGLAALSVLMVCATIGGRFPKRSSGQPSGGIPPGHPVGSSVDDVLEAMPRGLGGQTSFRELLAVLFASVVLALGSMALIGYMSGIETALSWRPSTMALPAAIASTAIGLGIVAFLLGQARTALPLWLALPFGVGFIAITLSLVHNVQRYEDQRFRQNLKIEARFLATQIDLHLGDLL